MQARPPVAALLSGCYRYVPATIGDLRPTVRVRVDVSPPRQVLVTTNSGALSHYGAAAVAGHIAAVRGDTLVLRKSYVLYADEQLPRSELAGDVTYVPDSTDRLRRRRLDRVRTTIAVAVPVTLVSLVLYSLFTLEFNYQPPPP